MWILVFAVSLFVLVKAANYFTKAAEHLGLYLRIPPFIVGVTIVSLGTTIPELSSSLAAVQNGANDIVAGTVVGSVVANLLLVLGLAALTSRYFKVSWQLIRTELPLLGGATIIGVLTMLDGKFTFFEALLALAAYIMYLATTIALRKTYHRHFPMNILRKRLTINWRRTGAALIISPVFIYLGAEFTIESLLSIARTIGVDAGLIGATALAAGTSLPDLTVALQSARRGKPEIAAGDVLGANIMNLLLVMGLAGLFSTTSIVVPRSLILVGLPTMLVATGLYFAIAHDYRITKREGTLLVTLYVFFVAILFIMNGR